MASRGRVELEIRQGPSSLAALRSEWEALWRRLPEAGPFQSPHWLLPWWEAFAPGEPLLFALRRAGRLQAILPIYREPGGGVLPIGIGVSDDLAPLIDPEDPEAAPLLLVGVARTVPGARIAFHALPQGSPLLEAPAPAGWRDEVAVEETSPSLALPADFATFLAGLTAVHRRNFRTAERRAARLGPLTFERADEAGCLDTFADLIRLHGAVWKTRGESGVLADPTVQRFHRLALPGLAAAGLLRLHRLRAGARTVAAYYGFRCGGRAYAYLGGFDPSEPGQSFGTLMIGRAMAEAIAEGARDFDFLRGGEAYKYAWGAVGRPLYRRILTPTEHVPMRKKNPPPLRRREGWGETSPANTQPPSLTLLRKGGGDEAAGCRAELRSIIDECAAGALSSPMTLFRMLLAAKDAEKVAAALAAIDQRGYADTAAGERVRRLQDLAATRGPALARVAALLREEIAADPVPATIAGSAALFDRLAGRAPEAAVALYSLGEEDLLDAATQELVELLEAWGALGRCRAVLDIGCGIGRLAAALHGRIGRYRGIDVSAGMIAAARRRCAGLTATEFAVTAGRDLAGIADRSFDLVLAIDSLPYLRRIGLGPVARHFHEAARVLRPSGDLVVFNYSYRGDLAADRAEVAALAEAAGFHLLRKGECALATWDGAGFHLRRSRVSATAGR